jgi:hypothetical protein
VSDTGTISSTPWTNIFPLWRIVKWNTLYVWNVVYHDNLIPQFTFSWTNSWVSSPYLSIWNKSIDVDMYVYVGFSSVSTYFQWSLDNITWNNVWWFIQSTNSGWNATERLTRYTFNMSWWLYYRFNHTWNFSSNSSVTLSHVSII